MSASCELTHKAYKNKLNHLICIAKRTYYDSKLEDAKYDLGSTWKLLNEVINKRIIQILHRRITDPMDIADRFCKYFTNIGPNLANAIPTVNSTFWSFLGSRDYPSIILKPTDTRELENISRLFSSRKAPCYDNISVHVINHSFHLISPPLTNIINLSLLKGIFPDNQKLLK